MREAANHCARVTAAAFPDDLREWLRDEDLLSRVFESQQTDSGATESLPLGEPRVIWTILIYSYAAGVYASDEIEIRTQFSIPWQYLSANTPPNAVSLRQFRRRYRELLRQSLAKLFQSAWEQHARTHSLQETALNLSQRGLALLCEMEAEHRISNATLADSIALDI